MRFDKLIGEKKFIVTVETTPYTTNGELSTLLNYIDGASVTALRKDGKYAEKFGDTIPTYKSIERAAELKRQFKLEAMPTITCRDFDPADSSIVEKLKEGKIENSLILYGDPNEAPYNNENYYRVKGSADVVKCLRELAEGNFEDGFCINAAANPETGNIEKEIEGLKKKEEAGASNVFTQPLFRPEKSLELIDRARSSGIKVNFMAGLLFFKSAKSPEFMEKRLGINIPEEVKQRMLKKGDDEGVEIAREIGNALKEKVSGFHVYAHGVYDKAVDVIKELKG